MRVENNMTYTTGDNISIELVEVSYNRHKYNEWAGCKFSVAMLGWG